MQTIHLKHRNGHSTIHIGNQLIEKKIISHQCTALGYHFVIITDEHVAPLYADRLLNQLKQAGKHCTFITIKPGEASKTREIKQAIEDKMLAAECGRDTVIIAIGGGVVTDLGGFVAATYCRGITSILVPTTLLAMVDAAIGGKTAVNTPYGKNLIGSFYQPHFVFCDTDTLGSLSPDTLADGLVESVKHALISDKKFFHDMDVMLDKLAAHDTLNPDALSTLVHRSCQIKCDIVSTDEYEQNGRRQLLNYGHTIAHALEREMHYSISHGQAVLAGLGIVGYMANLLDHLSDDEFKQIKTTLNKITYAKPLNLSIEQCDKLQQHMTWDKKSVNKQARFVLLQGIGRALIKDKQYSFAVDPAIIAQSITAWVHQ